MPEQTQKATIVAVHPPFVLATVDLDSNPGKDPKSNNLKVIVKGLGHKDVGQFTQAFLQVRQAKAEPVHSDNFSCQVVQVGGESLVFFIRRVDFNGGWNQLLRVQLLLVGETRD